MDYKLLILGSKILPYHTCFPTLYKGCLLLEIKTFRFQNKNKPFYRFGFKILFYLRTRSSQRILGSGAKPPRCFPLRSALFTLYVDCRVRLLFDGNLKKKKNAKFFRLCTVERVVRYLAVFVPSGWHS